METIERYYDQPQIVTKPEYYPVDEGAAGADDTLIISIVRRWRTALIVFLRNLCDGYSGSLVGNQTCLSGNGGDSGRTGYSEYFVL